MCASIISVIISATVSALVSIWILHSSQKRETKRCLDNELSEILKIGIDHPYFEVKEFVLGWNPENVRSDEKYAAYDLYATLVFNHLEKRSRYHDFDLIKIQNDIDIWSWVKMHQTYWENPCERYENMLGYDKRFVAIVESIITRKKGGEA